jgi:DNA polymerase III subunit alpha
MCDFSHLHCHTQYSLLDGAARIKKLVERASELEMAGLAITDHGNLFGVPEFYHAARGAGIQPIIGCEFYVAPSGMEDRSDRTRYHQVLLAKNEAGYRNLIKLSSLSYTNGYYYKPRIDRETLARHSEGLIATTCCLQGEVLQTILHRGEEAARQVFEAWLAMFGEDYYIEIQDHGIADQKRCNAVLLRWAQEYGVKVIATNDVHYVKQEDSEAQDVLSVPADGQGFQRSEPDALRERPVLPEGRRSDAGLPARLASVFRDEILDTTREIVDKCALELSMGKLLMPHYPIPPEFGGQTWTLSPASRLRRGKESLPRRPAARHRAARL